MCFVEAVDTLGLKVAGSDRWSGSTVGALIIRTGFWGGTPPNPILSVKAPIFGLKFESFGGYRELRLIVFGFSGFRVWGLGLTVLGFSAVNALFVGEGHTAWAKRGRQAGSQA